MMYAMNGFGPATSWVNYDLATTLVRNEWNFTGVTNTDWSTPHRNDDYSDMVIFAGVDSWLTGNSKTSGSGSCVIRDMDSATARTAYREAIHRIAFQIANSNAMQNVAPGSIVYYDMSPWVYWLIAIDVVGGVIVVGGAVWLVVRVISEKKYPEKYKKYKKM